ncbi:MAG: hypothetical protein H6806_01355 [Planctomycetes bacterium]|nr:hypothetical protein [Planctomycetota bacterium]
MPSADWHAAKELLGRTCRLDGADQRRAIFQASDVDDATRDLAWRLARTRRDLEGRAHLLAQAPPRWAAPTQPHPSAPASEGGLPAPGEIVAGRYELLQEIGCGAHGVVFAARDRLSIREVAIKLVALGCPHQQRRLDRELASLLVGLSCAGWPSPLMTVEGAYSYT